MDLSTEFLQGQHIPHKRCTYCEANRVRLNTNTKSGITPPFIKKIIITYIYSYRNNTYQVYVLSLLFVCIKMKDFTATNFICSI